MGKTPILIRMDDELYSEIKRVAVGYQMSVQQYILYILREGGSKMDAIQNTLERTRNDLYDARVNQNIMFSYVKELERRLLTYIREIAKNTKAIPSKENVQEVDDIILNAHHNVLKNIAKGEDVFERNFLEKILKESTEDIKNTSDKSDETDTESDSKKE